MSRFKRRSRAWLALGAAALFICALPAVASAEVTWTLQTTPNPAPETANSLEDISCAANNECIAVGKNGTASLAERWNGTEWSKMTSPEGGAALTDVSCPATGFCMAHSEALKLQRWNGSEWISSTAATPSGATSSYLYDVSCTSSSSCIAVGSYNVSGGASRTLAESWNGSAWAVMTTPSTEGGANNLYTVACTSGSSCTAIGTQAGKASALRWNGAEWASLGTPKNVAGPSSTISCSSASACMSAVGNNAKFDRWDGTEWSSTTAVTPEGASLTTLRGVSCPVSTSYCIAVGWYQTAGGAFVGLSEIWNGSSWSIQETPTPEPGSMLYGISCRASSRCMAAGKIRISKTENKTLALQYAESPMAIIDLATNISASEATLNGWVFIEDPSEYYFQYGTTTEYGSTIPLTGQKLTTAEYKVSQRLEGLTPNTTYHYRILIGNAHGLGASTDATFKTTTTGLAQHWYANWSKIAEKTPTSLAASATSNFVIKWNPWGTQFEVSCSGLSTPESTVENPAGGGAGTGKATFKLTGCALVKPGGACHLSSSTIEMHTKVEAAESGNRGEVKFVGEFASIFQLRVENCGGTFEFPFTGWLGGLQHGSNSTLEFTEASSSLWENGMKATLTGAAKIETGSGQSLVLLP